MTVQLGQVEHGLEAGRELLLSAMELLARPTELFRQLPRPERRVLTLTVFGGLKVEARQIVGHELREPFDALLSVQAAAEAPAEAVEPRAYRRTVVPVGWGDNVLAQLRAYEPVREGEEGPALTCWDDLTSVDLLGMVFSCTDGSSKAVMVEAPGIEPGSEAASRGTSTSVVPVLVSPERRPGTRLRSRPASVDVPPGAEAPPGGEAAHISVGSGPRGREAGRRQAEA